MVGGTSDPGARTSRIAGARSRERQISKSTPFIRRAAPARRPGRSLAAAYAYASRGALRRGAGLKGPNDGRNNYCIYRGRAGPNIPTPRPPGNKTNTGIQRADQSPVVGRVELREDRLSGYIKSPSQQIPGRRGAETPGYGAAGPSLESDRQRSRAPLLDRENRYFGAINWHPGIDTDSATGAPTRRFCCRVGPGESAPFTAPAPH